MKFYLTLNKRIDHTYQIYISVNNFSYLQSFLRTELSADLVIFIIDENVYQLHHKKISQALKSKFYKSKLLVIPAGESSKSQQTRDELEERIISYKPSRSSVLVAIGGGVVGDLTGFLASTVLRGIRYIQVPTTLISQVDSSIGGKTGINLPQAKNQIGTIYQPSLVLTDLDFLDTLPYEEYLNGFAEVIKTFIIADSVSFSKIEKNVNEVLARNKKLTKYCIEKCAKIKSSIVQKDVNELGVRKILNFGHTIGHAIEQLSDYNLKHGYAVAHGMIVESKISNMINLLSDEELFRIVELIQKLGFNKVSVEKIPFDSIYETMEYDKKKTEEGITFSLPQKIGNCLFNILVDKKTIKSAYLY
ncbi:MAG: 3-dehydroquinate synthase [Ignavibacteria bacterium]|nr:3-dehydroquinate synthase [Ignavibacteria bacterium]